MATITVTPGHTYGPTDTVTSTNLNDLGDPAVALDTGTIVNADISASADIGISKLEDVADMKVLGNTSGSSAAPQEVSVLDEDDMSSDSATALATQQSIKAYVDDGDASQIGVGQTWQSVTRDLSGTSYANNTGKPIMVKGEFSGNTDSHIITITVTPSGGSLVSMAFAISTNSGGGVGSNGSIIIPNNTEYSFTQSGAGITSHQFHELR
jgi:hypothetical protein